MSNTVTVHCNLPSGAHLRIFKEVTGPLGIKEYQECGRVTVGRGVTEGIDAAFWNTWVTQNSDSSVYLGGHVSAS